VRSPSAGSGSPPRSPTATHNCAVLRVLLTAAETTSHVHEKATGFPNDALVSYIQAAQARAGCPAGSGSA